MTTYSFSKKKTYHTKPIKKIIGAGIILATVSVMFYFFFPLISLQLFLGSYAHVEVPIPKRTVVSDSSVSGLFANGISQLTTDFTDARNWYPMVHAANNTSVEFYNISIPSLKIKNAKVSTIDYDLEKHLIQYAGTSIPGEKGTSVIFGHSTLPQFFNPENYKAIFATLHTIQEGDQITATVNDITYTYTVFSKTITSAEDTDMFSQAFDNSYITIVTCTPPGTVWKRLVVKARLASGETASGLMGMR